LHAGTIMQIIRGAEIIASANLGCLKTCSHVTNLFLSGILCFLEYRSFRIGMGSAIPTMSSSFGKVAAKLP